MNPPEGEETIFAEALSLPKEERPAFVAHSAKNNPELRRRLELLLASYDDGTFLEGSAHPALGLRAAAPISEKAGDLIGRYKLLQQIGEGGCGVVYMAEQTEPVRRRVALKVIKLGMDTKQVVARFEAERQALAMMDHPNIAKVLDGGTTATGRPYFVMELVRGMKITEYCDQGNLSTGARLELFTEVCQAIHHAHQKGIIHRDIKPSNILVTVNDGVAVPKVIDFGIAKATSGQQLTDKTLFTAFEQFIGTPAYMSPEQAVLTSLDIDTRSDIYALGVLLYELLTGKTPFDAKSLVQAGFDEMRRIIREEEPARPSTCLRSLEPEALTTVARQRQVDGRKLIHSLRGDLDRIVMKTLDKDRKRRYDTANNLAEDVARYLRDEPVSAIQPSLIYITWKLIRRRRKALAFAGMIAALGFLLVAVQEQRQLVRQARAAAETDAWNSRRQKAKLERAADLARMRLEEAEVLGRVIEKSPLSTIEKEHAQACVRRLADRIRSSEGTPEDHLLFARFLTQNARLEGPAIQSVGSPSVSFSMNTVRDYPFEGVGILIRPIVTTGNSEIAEPDWICANGGAGSNPVDLKNVVTKPGVSSFSCVLEAQLVNDRTHPHTWIGGGQHPRDYQTFGHPLRIPIPSIHRSFLQTLPTDYPAALQNDSQSRQLSNDIKFLGGRLARSSDGSVFCSIHLTVPKREAEQWAQPLPVAFQMEITSVDGQSFRKHFADFVNGRIFGTSGTWGYKPTENTVENVLKFRIRPEEAKALPTLARTAEVEMVLRSSRELALKHDELNEFLSFPEIKRTVSLAVEEQ